MTDNRAGEVGGDDAVQEHDDAGCLCPQTTGEYLTNPCPVHRGGIRGQ